jgi:hypothetical protein
MIEAKQSKTSKLCHSAYVTIQTCKSRITIVYSLALLIIAITTVCVTLVIYAGSKADAATARCETLSTYVTNTTNETNKSISILEKCLIEYRTRQTEMFKKLDELREELAEQRKEQKDLLEKILSQK